MGRRGEPTAPPLDFCVFYAEHYPRIVGAVDLYCGDRGLAEEASQQAMTKACADWQRVRGMRHPRAWAYRVAVNHANGVFRRRGAERRATQRLAGMRDDAQPQPDAAEAVAVRDALALLPDRQRTAVVLRYYFQFSLAEVADAMGAPLGTVKSLVHRGLAGLRRHVDVPSLEGDQSLGGLRDGR